MRCRRATWVCSTTWALCVRVLKHPKRKWKIWKWGRDSYVHHHQYFSDKLLFLSSDTEKRRRQFVTWISLYQNVQKWSDHRCTTIFRNKEDYAWWNDPAKCFFFIFMFTLVFFMLNLAKSHSFIGEKIKVAQNEKKGQLWVFMYLPKIFEAFHWGIASSINILFLKS